MATSNRLEHYRIRYAKLKLNWAHATARYQALVEKWIKPHFRILDLGCGRGGIVERLGLTGRWVGVDPDWQSLKSHRYAVMGRGCADANKLPFAKNSFDMVVSSWVLEHLSEPQVAFTEIARVLRHDGHFCFLTPNAKHPIPRFSRYLTKSLIAQQLLVQGIYRRKPVDTFSVQYQANTWENISFFAAHAGLQLVELELVEDPSYLAWNDITFLLAIVFENVLPSSWNVHIVGHYTLDRAK